MEKERKEDYLKGAAILMAVLAIGIAGLYLLQNKFINNKYVCTYLGRLWLPDKDKNVSDLYKCYTYKEYYK